MKASFLVKPNRVDVQKASNPSPGRGKVFVRVKEAGICVNAIAPGFLKKQLTEPVCQNPQKFELALSRIPL